MASHSPRPRSSQAQPWKARIAAFLATPVVSGNQKSPLETTGARHRATASDDAAQPIPPQPETQPVPVAVTATSSSSDHPNKPVFDELFQLGGELWRIFENENFPGESTGKEVGGGRLEYIDHYDEFDEVRTRKMLLDFMSLMHHHGIQFPRQFIDQVRPTTHPTPADTPPAAPQPAGPMPAETQTIRTAHVVPPPALPEDEGQPDSDDSGSQGPSMLKDFRDFMMGRRN